MTRLWSAIIGLSRPQVRSLYAVAMLCGIVAMSVQGWAMVGLMHHAFSAGELDDRLFGALVFVLKWTFYLIAGMTVCVALIVFGADWLKAKYGDAEIGIGKGSE